MSSERVVNGATRLVEGLQQLGVTIVFGLPGVHNLALWKALSESPIRLLGVRHEQAAVYAADGYARATGRLAVAAVTTGPGAANTLGATGEAMASGAPVLVIATDIPTTLRRPGVSRGVLHESSDQAAMFAPVTKRAMTVECPETLAADLLEAGVLALGAPSGPVYLGVPTDLLAASAPGPAPVRRPGPSRPPAPADLELALSLLDAARRPLLWAGGGAQQAEAGGAIDELARRLAAPVLMTYGGKGLLPPDHPCRVPGPPHQPQVGALWDEADLVIAIGSDFDGMMTQNWAQPAPRRLLAINVDREDASKNYPPDEVLVGDAQVVTEALAKRVAPRNGLASLGGRLARIERAVEAEIGRDDPQALELLTALAATLAPDAVVVADMCIPGYWLAGFHAVPAPRKLAYPVGWGTLGYAFPASLGAAAAGVGRAVCVCGDGGFLFACGELATAVQERLPVTVILVDDGGYGMLRFDQADAGDAPVGVDLDSPDFVALAGAFGVEATRVGGFGESFRKALSDSMEVAGPALVVVDAELRPPPITSPRWYRRSPA